MVEKVTGGKALPAEVVQQIVAKTDGVPLFVEELTKMVLESGLVEQRMDDYELSGPLPAGDSCHVAGFADGPAGSAGARQRDRAAGGDTWAGILLRTAPRLSPSDETTLQQGLRQISRSRTALSARLPPQATLSLQACADSRHGLSIAAQE